MKAIFFAISVVAVFALLFTGCPSAGEGGAGGDKEGEEGTGWLIPKTGQDADDHFATGDDGDLQMGAEWPVPRFTNNGNGTVTDNLTGLMWEQNPSAPATNSWGDALTYANDSTLAGHDDWRLPNRNELMTLHNFGEYRNDTWLNTNGFSDIEFTYYWTSTTRPGDTDRANTFYLGCRNATIGTVDKSSAGSAYPLIICRGASDYVMKTGQTESYASGDDGDLEAGVVWPSPRFTDNGDGTLADSLTGLIWEQSPDSAEKTWSSALSYANDSTLAGDDDWRLPNYYELATLLHAGQTTLYTWLNANGFANVGSGAYWTSSHTPILDSGYAASVLTTDSNTVINSVTGIEQLSNMRSLIVRGTADGE